MSTGTWIEVALNGPWGRVKQPAMPLRVAEIIEDGVACAHEGAAIVHVHAYDEASGEQRDDAELYARIIEGIRTQVDCIVYPTIPFVTDGMPAATRFAAIETLAKRGLSEMASIDPGSLNFDTFVYWNPLAHIEHGLALATRHRFHPSYAIYEPGFMRAGARFARLFDTLPQPVYRLMFSDGFPFGFPPRPYAVDAYGELLAECAPGAPWMIAGLKVDVLPLIAGAVARGGHVRVGIEDAPFGTERSNIEWVRAARREIEASGGSIGEIAAVRARLAGSARSSTPR